MKKDMKIGERVVYSEGGFGIELCIENYHENPQYNIDEVDDDGYTLSVEGVKPFHVKPFQVKSVKVFERFQELISEANERGFGEGPIRIKLLNLGDPSVDRKTNIYDGYKFSYYKYDDRFDFIRRVDVKGNWVVYIRGYWVDRFDEKGNVCIIKESKEKPLR